MLSLAFHLSPAHLFAHNHSQIMPREEGTDDKEMIARSYVGVNFAPNPRFIPSIPSPFIHCLSFPFYLLHQIGGNGEAMGRNGHSSLPTSKI